jgi:hypothetical protein
MPDQPKKTRPTLPQVPAPKLSSDQIQAVNIRRRLSTDEFQVIAAPKMDMDADNAATEFGKAASGIKRKLIGWGEPPPEIDAELAQLTRGPLPHPMWHELLRLILSPPPPASPAAMETDAKRILDALQLPLGRIMRSRSRTLERIRGLGVSACYFYRGADIVVAAGANLYDELAPLAERGPPSDTPFPSTVRIEIPTIGVLLLGRPPGNETLARLTAHLTEMRAATPRLLAFYEQQVVKAQNMGPMGCSPRTLRSGNPVRARYHA